MQLWAFGFRMFLSGVLESIFIRLDTLIIGKLFSPALLGFFNIAKLLDQMVIGYSSGSLISVLFPVLSKVQRDLSRFQAIIRKSLGVIVFVVFFLLGGLYLVSHELIMMLYGEKWLPSVDYFKILVLSGFGYPVSALLVNVLSSRGNSKAFLRLEIYKKIIGLSNLSIAFTWGIEGYLYGLFIVTILVVYLNMVFVTREIYIPKWEMVKPIIVQAVIAVFSVELILLITENMRFGLFTMFFIKGMMYVLFYIMTNKLFHTTSYGYFMAEVKPVYSKFLTKLRR
jgi:O-antigen/teichoic acid export membrane protein